MSLSAFGGSEVSRICSLRHAEARASVQRGAKKNRCEKPVLIQLEGKSRGTPRRNSLSLIYSIYLANSSSFAFFASSAASTGGKVGEKGTGLFGPFLRPRR